MQREVDASGNTYLTVAELIQQEAERRAGTGSPPPSSLLTHTADGQTLTAALPPHVHVITTATIRQHSVVS